jgi:two-component system, NarL family, nitrate/nitrite response regulator NarL
MNQKKIFLVDDHQLILDSLSTYIKMAEPRIKLYTAKSHSKAKELFDKYGTPDLLLLDYNMPDLAKNDITKKYASVIKKESIAIISGSVNLKEMEKLINLGYAGYIPKTLSVEAIISAIKIILTGSKYIPFEEYTLFKQQKNELSEKEQHILEMVTKGNTNREIAETLFVEEITVKVYIKKLCDKIKVRNRTELASQAIIQNLF